MNDAASELLEDQEGIPVPVLPDGVTFAGWTEPWKSDTSREEQYRQGLGVPFAITTEYGWGRPNAGEYVHLLRKISGSVRIDPTARIPRSRADDAAGPVPLSDLPCKVMLSATWKCGNATNGVTLLHEPDRDLCPACHGTPSRKPRRDYTPAVHALPSENGQQCQVATMLITVKRRCRKGATWRWASTPLCHTHLEPVRTWWFIEQNKRFY